jgi:hypothetical protein
MTKDDKAWRAALGVKQENVPIVVLLDAAGHVWTHDGVYADDAARELKDKLVEANR